MNSREFAASTVLILTVQDEERSKLEREADHAMAQRLAEEREKLLDCAATERQALIARYTQEACLLSSREQELELALLQAQSERELLELDLSSARESHISELRRLDIERKMQFHAMKVSFSQAS